ncbi:MAG: zinc ribbon domain-containing protein [Candidatus Levyibacteriota bacterium]
MDNPRCQSCGMPLSIETFGTNASGTYNEEYCKYCFQKGGFTDPDITLSQMIQNSVMNLRKDPHVSEGTVRELMTLIPTLKRWRNVAPV